MKRQWRIGRIVLAVVLVGIAVAALIVWLNWGLPAWNERKHLDAMERWPHLVAENFKGDEPHVRELFSNCFRKGDDARKYQHLLESAKREEFTAGKDGISVTIHRWYWDRGFNGEGDAYFEVHVKGGVIDMVFINPILN